MDSKLKRGLIKEIDKYKSTRIMELNISNKKSSKENGRGEWVTGNYRSSP